MAPKPSVLIVDESEDSRQVLRTALQRSGMEILEARRATQGLAMARRFRPNVIVLDLDVESEDGEAICEQFTGESAPCDVPLVVIGSARLETAPSWADSQVSADRFVLKPYQYAPLIRKIQQLAG